MADELSVTSPEIGGKWSVEELAGMLERVATGKDEGLRLFLVTADELGKAAAKDRIGGVHWWVDACYPLFPEHYQKELVSVLLRYFAERDGVTKLFFADQKKLPKE
jgi:hypothetical protein